MKKVCAFTRGKVYLPHKEFFRVLMGGFRGIKSNHIRRKISFIARYYTYRPAQHFKRLALYNPRPVRRFLIYCRHLRTNIMTKNKNPADFVSGAKRLWSINCFLALPNNFLPGCANHEKFVFPNTLSGVCVQNVCLLFYIHKNKAKKVCCMVKLNMVLIVANYSVKNVARHNR